MYSRLRDAVLQRYWGAAVPFRMKLAGVQLAGSAKCYGFPIVGRVENSTITIGERVALCSISRFTALGVSRPVVLRTLREGASITIGSDVGLSGTVICAAQSVHLGDECLLGADVTIVDTDFHPIAPEGRRFSRDWNAIGTAPVVIGNNVFIGTGSIIAKGVSIGDGAVIGAGSVVTRDIPAFCIAAGNPARIIRPIG